MPQGGFGQVGFGQRLESSTILLLTEACNDALGQIGQTLLEDIEEDTPTAAMCALWVPKLLAGVLRDHYWNFAAKDAALDIVDFEDPDEEDEAPTDWSYAFELPENCVRVRWLNNSERIEWIVQGRRLFTDEPTATIKYIAMITDPTIWDTLFYQAFVTRLASKLAMPLTRDLKLTAELYQFYQSLVSNAQTVDGQEQGKIDRNDVDDLIAPRYDA
jgi:hypothetical protein